MTLVERSKSKNYSLTDLFNGNKNKIEDELDREYISHCIQLSCEKKFKKSKETERNKLFKRCKICRNFKSSENLIYCTVCNDAYHFKCLNIKNVTEKIYKRNFKCHRCLNQEEKKNKAIKYKQLNLEQLFQQAKTNKLNENSTLNSDYLATDEISVNDQSVKHVCFKCKNLINDSQSSSTCEKCKNVFHQQCFRSQIPNKKEKKILCEKCEKTISNELRSTKISDYFKSKKLIGFKRFKDSTKSEYSSSEFPPKNIKLNSDIKREIEIYANINRAIEKNNLEEICTVKLRLPRKMSKTLEEKSMKSLFRGLEVKNIQFSDDLVFLEKDCPAELNNSLLESTIQKLSDENKQIYYKFKEKSRLGIYAPVEVVDDPEQRFVVKALDDMVTNTLVCEYSGEVSLARNRLFDDNDSIMDLIHSPTSDTSLVICPEKYGNLARFLSGINNCYKLLKKRKKQNVFSLRVNIDGSVHVLLITSRKIKKGEILYYDYNAGGYNSYNTEHFV